MTHIDPADPVRILARALDDVAVATLQNGGQPSAAALHTIAGEVLDELLADERPRPPAVERDADAVRLVDEVIDANTMTIEDSGAIVLSDHTAERIVAALFGIPTVILHDDGRLVVDWQDTPTHRPRACIVARDLLDDIVERLNGERTPSNGVEIHATPQVTEASNPDREGLLDALGDAIARAHEARPLVESAPALAALSPDCKAGKCTACTGDAWSDRLDAHTDCEHPCHNEEPAT